MANNDTRHNDARRANAAKGRAAKLAKAATVAAGVIAEPNKKAISRPRRERDREFGQRLASAIAKSGKSAAALNRALGLSSGYVAKVIRQGWHFAPDRLAIAAEFLGVDPNWLDGGAELAALVPVKKANGKTNHASAATMLDAAMHTSADTAMQCVWQLLAVDHKLFLIARANEFVARTLIAGG